MFIGDNKFIGDKFIGKIDNKFPTKYYTYIL